ncbi:hypothetical protein LLEC1_04621 [Akanthomyces lecanii]|uniref:Carbohydrate-binding module family 19 domain-containing protein n=1 Tax=Cordyceps confragosa TaxID=2714763 RepID=A0A179I2Q5_CORDF|nr:hypothetical protein LLEC1_04621 [Akanthomyces lecanii]
MKFIACAVAALATVAMASPKPSDRKCKPATYRCENGDRAWDVCNTSGEWVFAGRCPSQTRCKFNKQNGSPYCLPRGYTLVEDSEDEI